MHAQVTKLLIGNKDDVKGAKVVDPEQAREFAAEHNMLFMEASAMRATNVPAAFRLLRVLDGSSGRCPCPCLGRHGCTTACRSSHRHRRRHRARVRARVRARARARVRGRICICTCIFCG